MYSVPWGFLIALVICLAIAEVMRRRRTPEKDARNERIWTSPEFKNGAGYQGVGVALFVVALWVPRPFGWFVLGLGALMVIVGIYVMTSAFWRTR